jgi:hypothetical protein
METGHAHLGSGHHSEALKTFLAAEARAEGVRAKAEALQMQGVAHRLQWHFKTAIVSFEEALESIGLDVLGRINRPVAEAIAVHSRANIILAAKIWRDMGMCYLDMARRRYHPEMGEGQLTKAQTLLYASEGWLSRLGEVAESSASESFYGEYLITVGKRHCGIRKMRRACKRLRGRGASPHQSLSMLISGTGSLHPVYEMNSIIRLARYSTWWRLIYVPRALYLGLRYRRQNYAKLVEFCLLVLGGTSLVKYVRVKRQHKQKAA